MALSSATPLPGALARNTPPAAATAKISAPIARPVGVDQVDQLDVEPEIEGADPRAGPRCRTSPVGHVEVVGA